jgi:putative phosphoserine phosphatase / 1-acylglycerol-3-phosphate O-acyltransferase
METTFSKDSNNDKNYTAFFDLDRTITREISGNELIKRAFKKGLLARSDLVYAIYLSLLYKLNLREPLKIIDTMVSWVKGISEQSMTELCHEVFLDTLLPSVFKEARAEIKAHKTRSAKVIILSSALPQICLDMSNNLGMDDFICSELEVKNGFLTGHSFGHLCFGNEKAVRLNDYCRRNNIESSDAWYYGDSISDLPALSSVGNPVCVNPDNKLKKEAHQRGWKILWWH